MSEARIEFRRAEQSRDPSRKVNNKKNVVRDVSVSLK